MTYFIPVNEPLLDGNERKYLNQCIDSGWISSEGPFVQKFEEHFARRMGRKYGIAVSNGTAAIDVGIKALGIGFGDEVILPAFTIISCVNQIVRSGAIPVLVDVDPVTWNMKPEQVRELITDKTKAIMPVHIYGLPTDLDPIIELAEEAGLLIIEDAAEAHGQTYKGRPCGSFGDLSTFSFYPNKHLTTGEGGMVLTDSEELADRCRSLRNLCFQENNRFVHTDLGWNFRMTNLQAAVGLAQLERLDEFIEIKKQMGAMYTELLAQQEGIILPAESTDYASNHYWVFGILLEASKGLDARSLSEALKEAGVGTRPFFCPLHMQPVLQSIGLFEGATYPVSEHLYKYGIYLPSGLNLGRDRIEEVAMRLKRALRKFGF